MVKSPKYIVFQRKGTATQTVPFLVLAGKICYNIFRNILFSVNLLPFPIVYGNRTGVQDRLYGREIAKHAKHPYGDIGCRHCRLKGGAELDRSIHKQIRQAAVRIMPDALRQCSRRRRSLSGNVAEGASVHRQI